MRLGYSRVSTRDQTTDPQDDQLKRAGCTKIYSDVASGARAARPGLDALLAESRPGDTIVVWKLDRLGRSMAHLVATVNQLEKGGRKFVSLTEQIDTSTASGKLFFGIFASLAEFERGLIVERTRAGLSAARARGRSGGRPKGTRDLARAQMAAALMGDPKNSVTEVCRVLGVSRASAYRLAQIGRDSLNPPPAVPTPARTRKASSAERGVPPQAASRLASQGERKKAASSPRQPAKPSSKAKTPTTPRKGTKTTSTKRKS